MLTLSEMFIYPIKSMGGISLKSSEIEERGLKYDRRYLLVDENGVFMTQRDFPQMSLLKLSFTDKGFKVLNIKDNSSTIIPFKSGSKERIRVKIWDDYCEAVPLNKEVADWFSNAINNKCSLVYMPDFEKRLVEKKYIDQNHIVSFADAYPFLIIGQASLDDLNSKLTLPVPMDRFRPNFVFAGGNPYEEDKWETFKIGKAEFRAVKPCARCVITTTDQETAFRSVEPLKTLSEYRNIKNKVMFGMNLVCCSMATISINEKITLL